MHYGTSSSQERHDHVRHQSCNTAIAGFARAVERGVGHQPEDGSKMVNAGHCRGFQDQTERSCDLPS